MSTASRVSRSSKGKVVHNGTLPVSATMLAQARIAKCCVCDLPTTPETCLVATRPTCSHVFLIHFSCLPRCRLCKKSTEPAVPICTGNGSVPTVVVRIK